MQGPPIHTWINNLYPYLLFLFTLLPMWWPGINALVCTIVYYAWDLHRCWSVSNAFLSLFYQLVDISYRSLCMNLVETWSFELLIFKNMTLVKHMQNSSPPDLSDWMPYCTPLIPWFWTFSWLCASNVCTPFWRSYEFYAKIYNICSSQYDMKIMLLCGFHWHSRYSIWISTFILLHCVWF